MVSLWMMAFDVLPDLSGICLGIFPSSEPRTWILKGWSSCKPKSWSSPTPGQSIVLLVQLLWSLWDRPWRLCWEVASLLACWGCLGCQLPSSTCSLSARRGSLKWSTQWLSQLQDGASWKLTALRRLWSWVCCSPDWGLSLSRVPSVSLVQPPPACRLLSHKHWWDLATVLTGLLCLLSDDLGDHTYVFQAPWEPWYTSLLHRHVNLLIAQWKDGQSLDTKEDFCSLHWVRRWPKVGWWSQISALLVCTLPQHTSVTAQYSLSSR